MIKRFPVSVTCKRTLTFIPNKNQCLLEKDVSTIKNMSNVIAYIRLKNGYGFWYYLNNIHGNKIYGYKMNGNWWNYFMVDIRKISTYY